MLSPDTLQTPKSGRSRFSKALPAVPGLDSPSPLPPPPKDLPRLPLSAPSRPPRSDSITKKPIASPRPPLPPLKTTPSSPSSGPPQMSIPRRPVGKSSTQVLSPQQQSLSDESNIQMQAQTQSPLPPPPPVQTKELALPPPPELVSPSYSLSSLLSAYSDDAGESLVQTSAGQGSARESEAYYSTTNPQDIEGKDKKTFADYSTTISPSTTTAAAAATSKGAELPSHTQPLTRKPLGDGALPPPPPSKDEKYHLPKSPVPSRTPQQTIGSSSSPQPQIWRRRSISKGEKSLELPSLNLVASHGSTAATQPSAPLIQSQPQSQLQQPPSVPLKASPLPLPPPQKPGGLPGRNIRPTASHEQASEDHAMGNGASKLKSLKDNLHLHHRKDSDESSNTKSDTTVRPGAQRPPTPEYQKEDVRTPIVDTFVSPVSPASSPEPPTREVSPTFAKELPPGPPTEAASPEVKPIGRKAIPTPASPSSVPVIREDSGFGKAAASPEVTPQAPAVTEERAAPRNDAGNRGSAGSDAASSRTHQSIDSPRFAPRTFSDSRIVSSEAQGPVYRGRDGTLYPEMKILSEVDPRALYFPKQSDTPIPQGTIFKAVQLKSSHFNCYQKHKTMNRRVNRNYPLTCQTCEKCDAEDRWACTFCHLRICESCLQALNANERDLGRLIKGLGAVA